MNARYKLGISTRLGLQATYFFIGNVFTLLVGFPLQVFVVRKLGANELGLFSFTEGVMGVVAAILGFGLAPTLVKFIPVCLEKKDYQGAALLIKKGSFWLLGFGVLGMVLSSLLFPLMQYIWTPLAQYPLLVISMSTLIPITLMMYFLQQALRGFQEIGFLVFSNSFVQLGLKAVMAVVFLMVGLGLTGYVTAVVVSSLVTCLLLALGLRNKLRTLPSTGAAGTPAFDPEWRQYAKVMYGNSLLSLGASYLDRFLLGVIGGAIPVGIMMVVKQLQQMPGVFLQMFMAVITPMLSSAHARGNRNEQHQLLHFTIDWVLRLSTPLCIFLLVFSYPLLAMFGDEFARSGEVALRILVVAQFVHMAISPMSAFLTVSGKEGFLLRLAVWEQGVIIVAMAILVPWLGVTGAALALAINLIWLNLMMLTVTRETLAFPWLDRRYLRLLLPTILTVAVAGSVVRTSGQLDIPALILALLLLYVVYAVAYCMQGLQQDDRILLAYLKEQLKVKRGVRGILRHLLNQYVFNRLADLRGRGVYSLHADQFKCIFIHIPKAAGTSVALTLFNQGSSHIPWFEYYYANPSKFRRYYKFSFVRNPWDRLASTYFFLKRGGMNKEDADWGNANLAAYPTFESFVKGWVNEENIHSWEHFRPQHYFICDEEGRIQMDFVGRMENIEHDFAVVAATLGCTKPLAKVNVGNLKHYSSYYTEETRDIVANVYKKDIELFGYSFEWNKEVSGTVGGQA